MSYFNESPENNKTVDDSRYDETSSVKTRHELYYLLESGLKIAYYHSYHDHEDEFGRLNDFDPHKDIRDPVEKKYKSKVVKMCLLAWEEHTITRQYYNAFHTKTTTVWREKQKTFDTQMRHLTGDAADKAVQEWFKNGKVVFPMSEFIPPNLNNKSPTQP